MHSHNPKELKSPRPEIITQALCMEDWHTLGWLSRGQCRFSYAGPMEGLGHDYLE